MAGDPGFEITARPERRYPSAGGLEYEGGTRFDLDPTDAPEKPVADLVENVLATGPYRHGEFLELPMPFFLVRDDTTGDVFRVSVRDGTIRLHILPTTDSGGLRAFYDRLSSMTTTAWRVTRTVET
ncbi:MAG: hypothetical protein ABEH64_00875 [Salinirussus sp.]